MKYILFFLLIVSTSCYLRTPNKPKQLAVETRPAESNTLNTDTLSFIDSLDILNYFDYFGKTLKEALQDDIIKQFDTYFIGETPNGCFNYLQLNYRKELHNSRILKFYFKDLFIGDKRCVDYPDIWEIEDLLKEEIMKIEVPIEGWRHATHNKEEDKRLVERIRQIDFSKYYGEPIESLWEISVLWNTAHLKVFSDHDDNCLDYIGLNYSLSDYRTLIVIIEPESYQYMNPCINKYKEYWNLNDFRKETLKEVKVVIN